MGSSPISATIWPVGQAAKTPPFHGGNALYAPRRERDVLAVGAYDGDRLIGLAGCSADCETMWQIGVDVLPAFLYNSRPRGYTAPRRRR